MVTEEDNATIERMIAEGKSAIDIRAAVPAVSRTNVYLKIAKFKKHGTVGRVQTKTLGRPRVMGDGVDKFLRGLLAAKPDMELDEMRRHLQSQLQLQVSMSSISRAITRAGIANGRTTKTRNARRRKNKLSALAGEDTEAAIGHDEPITIHHDEDAHTDDLSPIEQSTWEHNVHRHPEDMQQMQQMQLHHPQHAVAQMQHYHHNQHETLHALDPSLAQVYAQPAMYHALYPVMTPIPRDPQHGSSMAPGQTLGVDIYRSPYGPI